MAFKLDDDLLQELGLAALPPQDKQGILQHILETLEMRVGTTLASQMSDQQLDEFEKLMPTEADTPEAAQQKERQALGWLESNFPNYKQVVSNELEKLKAEVKQSAPHILASSQQAAQQAQQFGQPQASQQMAPSPSTQSMPYQPNVQEQPTTSFSQPPQSSASYQTNPNSSFPPQAPQQPPYPSQQQPPYPTN